MDENKTPTSAPKLLTREEILAKTTLRSELVSVPEWGGTVRVRELTGAERDEYEASLVKMQDGGKKTHLTMDNARARLASLSIVDESGARVFTDDDIVRLGKLSASALDRVFDVAGRLSKITAEDFKELAGNSNGAPNVDSGMSSPSR
jgi:hypothetical protein